MHDPLPFSTDLARISTGSLAAPEEVARLLTEGYEECRGNTEGKVADYIPALAEVDPSLFGAAIVGAAGQMISVGDAQVPFSIQSVSKPFVFALVCDALGFDAARKHIGVNGTGLPFDSVMAIELNEDRTMNPMVNAGAIATTSLVPGDSGEDKWDFVQRGLSRFAGRDLQVDDRIYQSESATNFRNRGIAHLLDGYGHLYFDPDEATDVYTRQCSLLITAEDLALMGATLADGGVNPVTGETVVGPHVCRYVLAILATAGLYERSGEWLYEIGLPGKSGVSGGIVTIAPGKGSLATFSPPLDSAGNSVRGQRLTKWVSEGLALNLFASRPER